MDILYAPTEEEFRLAAMRWKMYLPFRLRAKEQAELEHQHLHWILWLGLTGCRLADLRARVSWYEDCQAVDLRAGINRQRMRDCKFGAASLGAGCMKIRA